jgi:hypothetical protein
LVSPRRLPCPQLRHRRPRRQIRCPAVRSRFARSGAGARPTPVAEVKRTAPDTRPLLHSSRPRPEPPAVPTQADTLTAAEMRRPRWNGWLRTASARWRTEVTRKPRTPSARRSPW